MLYFDGDQAYLVGEEPPVKVHFGVVPQALEDGDVALDVDVGHIVDLLRRQSSPCLQLSSEKKTPASVNLFTDNLYFSPRKKSVVQAESSWNAG